MDRFAHYAWPFFDERHAKLAAQADAWTRDNLGHAHGDDADAICKRLVQDLGCAGRRFETVLSVLPSLRHGREYGARRPPHRGQAAQECLPAAQNS